jgi:hypothetical protein
MGFKTVSKISNKMKENIICLPCRPAKSLVRVADNGMEGQNLRKVSAHCPVYSEHLKWPHPAALTEVGLPYFSFPLKGQCHEIFCFRFFS